VWIWVDDELYFANLCPLCRVTRARQPVFEKAVVRATGDTRQSACRIEVSRKKAANPDAACAFGYRFNSIV
jgi:hypothetical protein